jgi:uncharacterized OsmC-like protein
MSILNFSINGQSLSATKLETKARSFSFIIDEPPTLGGNDEGPNPVEYLLGSYAGCLNVVLHVVAKELEITIQKLNIEVNGDLDPNKFIGGSSLNRAGFQNINVNIDIETNVNVEQENKLIETAKSRCPVNDNLSNTTQINYFSKSKKYNLN